MAHNIHVVGTRKFCNLCGRESDSDLLSACQFSIEQDKINIEKDKVVIEKEKMMINKETDDKKMIVLIFITVLGYIFICTLIFVIYYGLDNLKYEISKLINACNQGGGWFAILKLFFTSNRKSEN